MCNFPNKMFEKGLQCRRFPPFAMVGHATFNHQYKGVKKFLKELTVHPVLFCRTADTSLGKRRLSLESTGVPKSREVEEPDIRRFARLESRSSGAIIEEEKVLVVVGVTCFF